MTSNPSATSQDLRPLSLRPQITMSASEVPKTCQVVTADTVAKGLLEEVRETLRQVKKDGGAKPCLAAFLANDDPAAVKYAEWSKKTCEEK